MWAGRGGSTAAAYAEAEEPVSTLTNDFGPPVASTAAGRQRAAMPFVHLEREIWDLRDGSGAEMGRMPRSDTATDPDQGADTAWAVADALHTAARATGSRAFRCAADTYDRASRVPNGRIPHHTPEGNQLRAAARLLAMTGGTPGDGMGDAVALAGKLVALSDAVAGLRQAQAHAAQAAAARQAAEQLHAALTAARIRVTRPGQTSPRSARPAAAAAEFPLPLADVLAAVSADSAEQRSKPQVATASPGEAHSVRLGVGISPDRLPPSPPILAAGMNSPGCLRGCGGEPPSEASCTAPARLFAHRGHAASRPQSMRPSVCRT